jgi:phage tail sheath protein FI
MARLSYSAPGVYVEEVPSAQQPIAGVGTSTAAFIGKVPNEIMYPVRNDNYDPRAAQIAYKIEYFKINKGIDATDDEKKYLEKLNSAGASDGELKRLQKVADEAKKAAETAPPEKKDAADRAFTTADTALRDHIRKNPKVPEKDVFKPYVTKKFTVSVPVGQAKLCTNFTEYMNYFGPFSSDEPIYESHRALTHAVYGFFLNGGTRCFVARIINDNELEPTLTTIESIDEVALVAAPGLSTNQTTWSAVVAHCANLQDRFAILDCNESLDKEDLAGYQKRLNYSGDYKDVLPERSDYAAFYFPWIEVVDPAKQLQDQDPARGVSSKYQGRVHVAPSGHLAGIYARTDIERGVFKAPANCAIRGAINVKYYLSQRHQEGLNPQGVNCIRNVNGNVTVWGARTIGGDLNMEWKYINVRRTMLFIRESIDEGTQWVVFEPNDVALWGKIKRNVSAFLTNVWRSGALFGATPEEAFYVKCDAELNPPEVRDLGQVITEIGVAIVRPAEFVIFRISQSTGTKA